MEKAEEKKILFDKSNFPLEFSNHLGIVIALAVVLVILIAFYVYKKSIPKRDGILLLGLCDAGKTLIFARLVFKKYIQTHTSIQENANEYKVGDTTLRIIDLPGHERLRAKYFDQFKSSARGLMFVIDSVTIQKDIKDVAEFLYNCLTDTYVKKYSPPLLILCNKQDEVTARGSTIIKMMLEKEINILRTTQSSQLESIGKTTKSVFLGKNGKDFEFSHLSPMKIDFAECSALFNEVDKDYNMAEVEAWINKLL